MEGKGPKQLRAQQPQTEQPQIEGTLTYTHLLSIIKAHAEQSSQKGSENPLFTVQPHIQSDFPNRG
uniref:Uncharacterized protein n=1 Tax=Anguilla anguilla TaxID=7936 RepID=A0A0E9T4K3_ANGAN